MGHDFDENSGTANPRSGGCGCGENHGQGATSEHAPCGSQTEDELRLREQVSRFRHKVIVLSGKGGVGKSTVSVNMATALALEGKTVGLLDIDIHGPSVPTMLGLESVSVESCEDGILPVEIGNLKVMSLGFLLQSQDDAVIWRGPMKMGVIEQLLKDVVWGDLDYLVVDSPPGTGDELLSICQLLGDVDGAVIVTTPQKVSAIDVRKSITFCRKLQLPIIGVVENMSGFACPHCGETTSILRKGGGSQIASDMGVPLLTSIPIDPQIATACDNGRSFINHYADTPTAELMRDILTPLLALDTVAHCAQQSDISNEHGESNMKIAIPLADGKLTMHFGHCQSFALVQVDPQKKTIISREDIAAPPHEPGLLPPWLAERGANVIIAGGMGQRAQNLFTQQGITVLVGAPSDTPESLVTDYLSGTLVTGVNTCDH